MCKVTIWRPAEGICLNTEMEQLLDRNEQPRVFESKKIAMEFIEKNGLDPNFYVYAPELCEGCKRGSNHTLQEREERVDPDTGKCPEYDFQDGGRV